MEDLPYDDTEEDNGSVILVFELIFNMISQSIHAKSATLNINSVCKYVGMELSLTHTVEFIKGYI